jgi:hypothetical protein
MSSKQFKKIQNGDQKERLTTDAKPGIETREEIEANLTIIKNHVKMMAVAELTIINRVDRVIAMRQNLQDFIGYIPEMVDVEKALTSEEIALKNMLLVLDQLTLDSIIATFDPEDIKTDPFYSLYTNIESVGSVTPDNLFQAMVRFNTIRPHSEQILGACKLIKEWYDKSVSENENE